MSLLERTSQEHYQNSGDHLLFLKKAGERMVCGNDPVLRHALGKYYLELCQPDANGSATVDILSDEARSIMDNHLEELYRPSHSHSTPASYMLGHVSRLDFLPPAID